MGQHWNIRDRAEISGIGVDCQGYGWNIWDRAGISGIGSEYVGYGVENLQIVVHGRISQQRCGKRQ